MCLILFAYGVRADAPLIVAANRDEFYARPATAAHRWHDTPTVLAGRDLQAGGTWLGVSATGRFAAVTNFSETPEGPLPPGSRGDLTADFLRGDAGALDYANTIDNRRYRGFSLLLWDGAALVYASNRNSKPREMPKGVHGLANTHLDGTWPKVVRGTRMLADLLKSGLRHGRLDQGAGGRMSRRGSRITATRQRGRVRTAHIADLHPRRRIWHARQHCSHHRHTRSSP